MNEILAALHARKSTRAYTGEPVSAKKKEMILNTACAAPTARNGMMRSPQAAALRASRGREMCCLR